MENKINYLAPETKVLELRQEGVICQSLEGPGFGYGGELPLGE